MNKLILSILILCGSLSVMAQAVDTARSHPFKQYVPQDELDQFNIRQNLINRRGMWTLGGWGLGNIVYGSIAAPLTHGEARYFHATNAIWGGVNFVIAIPGIVSSYGKTRSLGASYGKTILQQHGQEKLYLINGGLDFAYIGAGAAMWGFSNRIANAKTREGVSGAGKASMIQGAFLLFFDWSMYIVHSQHAFKKLNRYTAGLAYTGTGFSYNLEF